MKKDKKWLIEEISKMEKSIVLNRYSVDIVRDKDEVLSLVNQLDEPQKVVVPKWFDEWYRDYNGSFTYTNSKMEKLRILYVALETHKFSSEQEKHLIDNQDDFIRAILDGYEVEEEKLYWVRDKNGKSLIFRNRIDDKISTCCGNGLKTQEEEAYRYQFTEAEIKAYDERYVPFMVPVEEVDNE